MGSVKNMEKYTMPARKNNDSALSGNPLSHNTLLIGHFRTENSDSPQSELDGRPWETKGGQKTTSDYSMAILPEMNNEIVLTGDNPSPIKKGGSRIKST